MIAVPKVSVCIQTYQHARYIRQCLDSVLMQQTSFPFEIILGEDDSTDGTRELCISYAEKYPDLIRLFLRSEKDKVYIDGKKTGRFNYISNLQAAKGKYIALLDGDDYWSDMKKLQLQFEFMEANSDCSISFHKVSFEEEIRNNHPFCYTAIHERNAKFTLDDFIDEKIPIPVSGMFRADLVPTLPEWLWKVPVIDFPLYFHCSMYGKVGFLAKTMGVYRIHKNGIWSSKDQLNVLRVLWSLYSVMAQEIDGAPGRALMKKRWGIGQALIRYYKTHLWEESGWLRKDLRERRFPEDETLDNELNASLQVKHYCLSFLNYGKKLTKKFLHQYS